MSFIFARVLEAKHLDQQGNVLWEATNLPNTFHIQGEEFLLKSSFHAGSGVSIPSAYYVGLDNRISVSIGDTLDNITGEPTTHGYIRQSVSSSSGFGVSIVGVDWTAISKNLLFSAVGGGWGPVKNAFLTTGAGNVGFLIATVPLLAPRTLVNGETFTFRLSLGLRNS